MARMCMRRPGVAMLELQLSLVLLLLSGCHVSSSLGSSECEALGFSGLGLCSDCNLLAEYVKDAACSDFIAAEKRSKSPFLHVRWLQAELEADCRKCCTPDDDDDANAKKTFASAILEVCMRRVSFYPAVYKFIEEKAQSYKLLSVKYTAHATPKLLMMDAEGQLLDTVMIDSWRTAHIEAYLQQKLKAAV